MKKFMDKDFVLTNETAKTLYHNYAKDMPIFDFHCHLPVEEIWNDLLVKYASGEEGEINKAKEMRIKKDRNNDGWEEKH